MVISPFEGQYMVISHSHYVVISHFLDVNTRCSVLFELYMW